MKRRTFFFGLVVLLTGATSCGPSAPVEHASDTDTVEHRLVPGRAPFPFRQFDQNVTHDTLLVQTTFDLGDSSFIMVASNVEETFEGLRLLRYRFKPDSTVEMMAVSSPAYDSWTMLPTFFPLDTVHPDDANWVLANFGEKESWGQKLMMLDWDFMDVGFMDVALPERVMEDDTLRLKRRNVAPYMRYEEKGDTAIFHFACDSVYLYDDQAGKLDQVIAAERLRFTFQVDEGLALWMDGRKRLVKKPS
ncbi:MAG: hypothetical protein IT229_10910 [Flavobacteriales bacterium]|nr:hypothetical protein [Flavobacteriales bacterium]